MNKIALMLKVSNQSVKCYWIYVSQFEPDAIFQFLAGKRTPCVSDKHLTSCKTYFGFASTLTYPKANAKSTHFVCGFNPNPWQLWQGNVKS